MDSGSHHQNSFGSGVWRPPPVPAGL